MAKARKGKYIVGEGKDFRPAKENHIGYDNSLDPNRWYIVDGDTLKILGSYETRELAINLAIFLDKADHLKLDNEIEKILSNE